MQPTEIRRPRRAIRVQPLIALPLLLVIAALNAACPGPPANGNNNVSTQSVPGASATPSPNPSQGVNPDPPPADGSDDRPIIITGGSLDVEFNGGLYVPTSTAPGLQTFRSTKNKLVAFRVYDDDKSDVGTLICGGEHTFPTTGESLMRIVFKVNGGGDQNMDIAADSSNESVSIIFNTDSAHDGLAKPDKSKYRHFNKKGTIVSVGWRDGTSGPIQTCADLPSNKKMSVEVDTTAVP